MALTYLLDTNICIYIRQSKPERLVARFQALQTGEAALSVITYGELLYGVTKSANRTVGMQKLRELMSMLPALPLPEAAAMNYGSIRAELEQRGEMIGSNDLWIAAHAMAADLTLITNNEKEFRRVPGLSVENWAS